MCGIIGYSGHRQCRDILLEGLSAMEYRGYDSAGITTYEREGLRTIKAMGRLINLEGKVGEIKPDGSCGIGHTRWATHGEPSDTNAHPHYTDKLSLVHNGIIENYQQLKQELIKEGYVFISQTDTEVASKLVDYYYSKTKDPLMAIKEATNRFEGSYALAIIFEEFGGALYLARKGSPLVIAQGHGECFVASDISAVIKYNNQYQVMEDGDIAYIYDQEVNIYNEDVLVDRPFKEANWTVEQAKKNGYDHYMLKEIYEQPKAISDTINPRISNGVADFTYDGIPDSLFETTGKIHIVACGTSMYAGMVGKSLIESLARICCNVEIASEFRYNQPIFSQDDLVILISQSGETADTLAALRLAKGEGVRTIAIVNAVGSSMAREADYIIQTFAGPEIAVASTKAYSVQIAVLYLLSFKFGYHKGLISHDQLKNYVESLHDMSKAVSDTIAYNDHIKSVAESLKDVEKMFFIGRGIDYSLACEGSLKMKEISYIFSEVSAAGELKHGHISLVEEGLPTVAIMCQQKTAPKTMSNIKEVKARKGRMIILCKEGVDIDTDNSDMLIHIPCADDLFAPLPVAVALQLLAYHTAVIKDRDVDCPRNLAKSVTVE